MARAKKGAAALPAPSAAGKRRRAAEGGGGIGRAGSPLGGVPASTWTVPTKPGGGRQATPVTYDDDDDGDDGDDADCDPPHADGARGGRRRHGSAGEEGDDDLMALVAKIQRRHDEKNVSTLDRLDFQTSESVRLMKQAAEELVTSHRAEIKELIARHQGTIDVLEAERRNILNRLYAETKRLHSISSAAGKVLKEQSANIAVAHESYVGALIGTEMADVGRIQALSDGLFETSEPRPESSTSEAERAQPSENAPPVSENPPPKSKRRKREKAHPAPSAVGASIGCVTRSMSRNAN